jgi:hypothetical protein
MIVNAQDLFQNSGSEVSSQVSTTTASTSGIAFDPFTFLSNPELFRDFISRLNYFTLAWCVFYSALFMADFFFCRMYYSDGEVGKEEVGISSIKNSAKLWWSYLIAWLFYVLYSLSPVFGLLTILVYFWKLLFADLPIVLGIIHNYIGYNGTFGLYRKIVDPIRDLFSLNFRKKKK